MKKQLSIQNKCQTPIIIVTLIILATMSGCSPTAIANATTTAIYATAGTFRKTVTPQILMTAPSINTPSPSASPTRSPLIFSTLTPSPPMKTGDVIEPENVNELTELTHLGPGSLQRITISPADDLIATGTSAGVYLLEEQSLSPVRVFSEGEFFNSIEFSDDGQRLLGFGLGKVKVWEVSTGNVLLSTTGDIASISPDGSLVAIGQNDGGVRIEMVNDHQKSLVLEGHPNKINDLRVSPDNSLLATASEDKTVRLWDLSTGRILSQFRSQDYPLASLALSPDMSYLASGTTKGQIYVWKLSNNELAFSEKGQGVGNNSISFSPDGAYLIAASSKSYVNFFSVQDGKFIVQSPTYDGTVKSIQYLKSKDQVVLEMQDESITIVHSTDFSIIRDIKLEGYNENNNYSYVLSKDNSLLATASNNYVIQVWEVTSGNLLYRSVGKLEQFDDQDNLVVTYGEKILKLDQKDGKVLKETQLQNSSGYRPVIAPDLSGAFSWQSTRLIYWSLKFSPSQPATVLYFQPSIYPKSGVFSPDGRLLALVFTDGSIKILDTHTRGIFTTLEIKPDTYPLMAFSSDHKLLAMSDKDGLIQLYQLSNRKLVQSIQNVKSVAVSMVFSPDSRIIAVLGQDGSINFWNVETGDLSFSIPLRDRYTSDIGFSSDGTFFVRLMWDGQPIIYGITKS
jgi:WD40 repeat protein